MVYTIYETNCIVFEIKNIQENDCLIKAFSDKFGIINIIATSFRKQTSKLKGNIKAYSVNKIAIVRGREFFRLTDVDHLFSFAGSKSLVNFLKLGESLFFNDERDYFDEINNDIYKMIICLCKFIIYIIKEDIEDKKDILQNVNMFFTVYIRGLQGFTEKIDVFDIDRFDIEFVLGWFKKEKTNIKDCYIKIIV